MSWYVLYIKPRYEIRATAALTAMNITVYCPLVTKYRQWSDRIKKIEVPLINSYIFVELEERNRHLVFQVPWVVRYLFWLGKPAIVRSKEITIMQQWLQDDLQEAHVEQLKPGDYFSIPKGPFKGQEGIVHEVSKNRLQLLLVALGIKITLKKKKKQVA